MKKQPILIVYLTLLFLSTLIGFFVMPAGAVDGFVNNGDGTVTDTRTGLMWAAKDNGSPINWPDALSYCQNYTGGGHTDWRLPTDDFPRCDSDFHARLCLAPVRGSQLRIGDCLQAAETGQYRLRHNQKK